MFLVLCYTFVGVLLDSVSHGLKIARGWVLTESRGPDVTGSHESRKWKPQGVQISKEEQAEEDEFYRENPNCSSSVVECGRLGRKRKR